MFTMFHIKNMPGWWLSHPSEKYEFVSWDDDIPNSLESHKIPWFQTTKQYFLKPFGDDFPISTIIQHGLNITIITSQIMLKIVNMAFSSTPTTASSLRIPWLRQGFPRRPDTVGSTRGMVWQLAGLFGHQRFKNCSDWQMMTG